MKGDNRGTSIMKSKTEGQSRGVDSTNEKTIEEQGGEVGKEWDEKKERQVEGQEDDRGGGGGGHGTAGDGGSHVWSKEGDRRVKEREAEKYKYIFGSRGVLMRLRNGSINRVTCL